MEQFHDTCIFFKCARNYVKSKNNLEKVQQNIQNEGPNHDSFDCTPKSKQKYSFMASQKFLVVLLPNHT